MSINRCVAQLDKTELEQLVGGGLFEVDTQADAFCRVCKELREKKAVGADRSGSAAQPLSRIHNDFSLAGRERGREGGKDAEGGGGRADRKGSFQAAIEAL